MAQAALARIPRQFFVGAWASGLCDHSLAPHSLGHGGGTDVLGPLLAVGVGGSARAGRLPLLLAQAALLRAQLVVGEVALLFA